MSQRPDIADALAEIARELNTPRDLEATLDAIVTTAQRSVPNIEHVGISVAHKNGQVETKSATDQLVWELDQLQYDLGEGPCLHAITSEPVTRVDNLASDPRWPRYIPRAVEYGVRAQLGLRLYVDEHTLGGINFYSTNSDTISADAEHAAELFATHAALALGRARREDDLNAALQTRKIIGQAIGMIMERYHLDEERAVGYLIRVSQHSNIKLRDIAAELVQQGNERIRPSGREGDHVNRPGMPGEHPQFPNG
jgi:GAF domain-containing protein